MPKIEIKDGYMYTDGIRAEWWQLTDEEKQAVHPERFRIEQLKGQLSCPFCNYIFSAENRAGIIAHVKPSHTEWYALHVDKFRMEETARQMIQYMADNRPTEVAA